jgi:4-amino-4-deoxy-L-arabinose transferase-like glycosyltransferase
MKSMSDMTVISPGASASKNKSKLLHLRRVDVSCPTGMRIGSLGLVLALYLLIAGAYSVMVPAWEANDEAAHVSYVEYIVRHGDIPLIAAGNGTESHQAPLYYLVESLWQRALQVPAFYPDPQARSASQTATASSPGLLLSHNYTPDQRTHAVYDHELRVLSLLLGLCTLVCTYGIGWSATRNTDVALVSTAFVALLPKFDVVSAAVTNDAMVIPLCSLALLLFLRYFRAPDSASHQRHVLAALMGLTLGAAALTKSNSLPLVPILIFGIYIVGAPWSRRSVDVAIAAAAFLATSGWWFVRNYMLYGDILAQHATNTYLQKLIPGLVAPVPWSDTERFLDFVPNNLMHTVWYDGGWNQFQAPSPFTAALSYLAIVALIDVILGLVRGGSFGEARNSRRIGLALALTVLAGLAAVLAVAQDSTQAEGRVAYIGLSAFAVLVITGTVNSVGRSWRVRAALLALWPLLLSLFNLYVFTHFVLPFRHL